MKNPLSCRLLLAFLMALVQLYNAHEDSGVTEVHVGVILDMGTWVGKVSNSCIYMALSDFYSDHADYKTRLVPHTKDSQSDVLGAAFAGIISFTLAPTKAVHRYPLQELVKDNRVDVIMGPQRSDQTEFIVDLGSKLHIPIISFSATIPSIYSRSDYFIRTTPDDHTQVKAIAAIAQYFMWRKVILVHEDTDYGTRLVPYLINAFQEKFTRIAGRVAISPLATEDQIFKELDKLVSMQISIFVVHMSASFGAEFFLKAEAKGMMTEGYVWIITNGLMNVMESMKSDVISAMQGVLGVNPYYPRSDRVESFTLRWRKKFIEDNPEILDAEMITFGLQAYDSTVALAMAAERVEDLRSSLTDKNEDKFLDMEVSQEGPKLLEEIRRTEFEGLGGKFRLVNGQLEPAAIQILNIIGEGGREIGFWTLDKGISRDFPPRTLKRFKGIIWPGESTNVPNDWLIPMDRKLKIGVPVHGFKELVNVKMDPYTNASKSEGFIIDVFNAAIQLLEYTIPFEFVPFLIDDYEGSYTKLIDQVYIQEYDAIVGDVTITANRSLYVDFSFPFTEGGVWMIVPFQQTKETRSKWNLLPSHAEIFIYIFLAFFTFISSIVYVLEAGLEGASTFQYLRDISNDALPRIINDNRKKIISGLLQLMVILWFLLNLALLITCFSALLQMFPTDHREATVTDFNDLRVKEDFVGYRRGSHIKDLLKRSQFNESKLKSYSSPEECHELLTRGSENGGVAAVFDEMPNMEIFLSKYCSLYTKVGLTHRTDGYGFVFPLGSPLVSDMSNAILGITEGHKLNDIFNAWFPPNKTCPEERFAISRSRSRTSPLWVIVGVVVVSYSCMSCKEKQKTHRC